MAEERKLPPYYGSDFTIARNGVIRFKDAEQVYDAFHAGRGRVDKNDIYVTSYPKSGTQWVHSIVGHILTRCDKEKFNAIVYNRAFDVLEPGYTLEEKLKIMDELEGLRIFQFHSYYDDLPLDVQRGKCKVIQVLRNPKDVCVSFYHFHKMLSIMEGFSESWSSFLEMFMTGNVGNGDWFSHVFNWWKHKDEQHLLFVKYEDLKKKNLEEIRRIAAFLGQELSDDEIEKVSAMTGLEATKKMFTERTKDHFYDFMKTEERSQFVRKGQIGDWKNHFTVAQNEAFDELYKKKMEGSDLYMEFE